MHVKLKRYQDPAPGEPKDAQQVVFLIRVGDETCDFARSVLAKP